MKILYISRHFNKGGYYILEHLIRQGFDIAGIVLRDEYSPFKDPWRRPWAIARYHAECAYYRCQPCKFLHSEELSAKRSRVPILLIDDINSDAACARIEALSPDVALIGGGWHQRIAPRVFNLPPYGTLNVHPSLLPAFRGTTVHRWQILHGVTESGVSIHYVEEDFDTGAVVGQTRLRVGIDDTPQVLADKAGRAAVPLVHDILGRIRDLAKGGRLDGMVQSPMNEPAFRAWKWDDALLEIDWRRPLRDVYNLIRAAHQESYKYKGPIMRIRGKPFLVRRARLAAAADAPAGEWPRVTRIGRDGVWIARSGDGDALILTQVQPGGPDHARQRAFPACRLAAQGLVAVGDRLGE